MAMTKVALDDGTVAACEPRWVAIARKDIVLPDGSAHAKGSIVKGFEGKRRDEVVSQIQHSVSIGRFSTRVLTAKRIVDCRRK